MLTRRTFLVCAPLGGSLSSSLSLAQSSGAEELLVPFDAPDYSKLTEKVPFGSYPASAEQRKKVDEIIARTPKGPRPIDVAQSFIDRFGGADPQTISEWPANQAWNPLIAQFFAATNYKTSSDTVAWCAAFLNWCLERAQRPTTKSPASQSFVSTKLFESTTSPSEGDIAVFTCYEPGTTKALGIGHVTFFKRLDGDNHFLGLGGNQKGKTPSIISEYKFPMSFSSSRTVDSKRVPVDYRLNRFLRVT